MKIFFVSLLIMLLYSCVGTEKINTHHELNAYLIKKIERKKDWYIILANRHDSAFQIVSKQTIIINPKWETIKIGNYYNLILNSIIPIINGIKILPANYLDYEGVRLDARTSVNINPDKGIFDIYSANNLNGLFLIK